MAKAATLKARTSDVRKAKPRSKRGSSDPETIKLLRRDLADFKAISRRENEDAAKNRYAGVAAYQRLRFNLYERARTEQPAIITIADVVHALGGTRVVKDWLRASEESIGRWEAERCVAGGHRLPVYLALVDLGYTRINPELFDMASWEDSRLPHMRRPERPLQPAGMEKVRRHLAKAAA